MIMSFKENDVVCLTDEAIAQSSIYFGKASMFRGERGRCYRVRKVIRDEQNDSVVVFLNDINGKPIHKFECGVYGGHLRLLNDSV